MPYDDPDPADPSILVGVCLPGDAASMHEMARVFADEFARMGHTPRQILGLFEDPFFAGPHAALQVLGVLEVKAIIAECAGRWPRVQVLDAPEGASEEEHAYAALLDEEEC
jgi:hypothetical protein